jgi:hypothetical protein
MYQLVMTEVCLWLVATIFDKMMEESFGSLEVAPLLVIIYVSLLDPSSSSVVTSGKLLLDFSNHIREPITLYGLE